MRSPIRRVFTLAVLLPGALLAADGKPAVLQSRTSASREISLSLANEARAAINRGTQWLLSKQQEGGHWSNPGFPALTALPLWALAGAQCSDTQAMDRAVAYILSCVHDNGAIYREPDQPLKGGGLSNYNTAICMVALHLTGRPEVNPVVLKARQFVARSQHLGGDIYRGGMGYDEATGRPYADLSNSYIAYEAMRLTEGAEDFRKKGEKKSDLDWDAARAFVQRVHNDADFNTQSWAAADADNKGGFAYHPEQTRAGTTTNAEGVVTFRSFGSMTYAGLLSYIYAEVDRDDPRVKSTVDWAVRHWTLEENPGTGAEGLFYFYNVLAKGLAAYGRDEFTGPDGNSFNWRAEFIRKLLSLQKTDEAGRGYWVNDVGRYWESDPVLVTSYSLIALEIALGEAGH